MRGPTAGAAGLLPLLAAALLSCAACDRGPRTAAPSPSPVAPLAAEAPPAPAPVDPALRYVTVSAPLRRAPADPPRQRSEAKGATPPPVAFLYRGERVTLLESQGDWSRVRASDGAEGWLRSATLLPVADATEATVLAPAWAFDRPDLLAVNAKRKVEPGTLLLAVKTRELFTEVDVGAGVPAWVLSSHVTTRPEEVMAAKLVEKARWLARADRPEEAREVLALLRASQPSSPLVAILAVELGEAPPAGAAGATGPTGPTGPSGPTGATGPAADPGATATTGAPRP